jgi:hypothetical protein
MRHTGASDACRGGRRAGWLWTWLWAWVLAWVLAWSWAWAHVANGVATAAENERGHLLCEHEAHALCVAVDRQIEAAEPVAL